MRNTLTTRQSNWNILDDLERHLDEIFNPSSIEREPTRRNFSPALGVHESEHGYTFSIDLPGLSKDEINIEAKGDQVTISGERKSNLERIDGDKYYSESAFGEFYRTLSLPENSDSSRVEAKHSNGVLTLFVAKKEKELPQKIEIVA